VEETRPPFTATLRWSGGLRFEAGSRTSSAVVDGDGEAGPSPVQFAAFGLVGCMAADVVAILQKGRHPLDTLTATMTGERAPEHPRRFVRIAIAFQLKGDVPAAAVSRAIELSRTRYCSVWHSFRQDIEFTTTFTISP
jgi:putative redox protein